MGHFTQKQPMVLRTKKEKKLPIKIENKKQPVRPDFYCLDTALWTIFLNQFFHIFPEKITPRLNFLQI